jgi:hypothetical protein
MEFKLQISFSAEQLENIDKARLRVILAKQNTGRGVDVAWQAIDPMPFNEIIWQENYGIYASTAGIKHGAVLIPDYWIPVGAASNKLYILTHAGRIAGPGIGGAANSFALENQYDKQPMMTIGLFQDANVNGVDIAGNACSAAPVLLGSIAVMTPDTTISVWLQSDVESNTVVTTVTSPVSNFKFGGDLTAISIEYDSVSGSFYRAS